MVCAPSKIVCAPSRRPDLSVLAVRLPSRLHMQRSVVLETPVASAMPLAAAPVASSSVRAVALDCHSLVAPVT